MNIFNNLFSGRKLSPQESGPSNNNSDEAIKEQLVQVGVPESKMIEEIQTNGGPAYFVFAKEVNGSLDDDATEDAKNKFTDFANRHKEVVLGWQGLPLEDCKAQAMELEPDLFK